MPEHERNANNKQRHQRQTTNTVWRRSTNVGIFEQICSQSQKEEKGGED